MSKKIVIEKCMQCPLFVFTEVGSKRHFCNYLNDSIEVDPMKEISKSCELEENEV